METKDKIIRARVHLQSENPFFAYLVMNLNIKENSKEEHKTMGVDGKGNMYYNKKWIEKLSDEELKGVLCHEVLHLVLEHFIRGENKEYEIYNIAGDLVINNILINNDFNLPKGLVPLNNSFTFDKLKPPFTISDLDKKSADEVYSEIMKHLPKQKQKQMQVYIKIRFDEHIYNKDSKEKNGKGKGKQNQNEQEIKENQDKWKKIFTEAKIYSQQKGQLPKGMERLVDLVLNEKINWKNLLYKYITREIMIDYTYNRPSKRSVATGIFMPSILKESINIVVAVDTSGCFVEDTLIYTNEGIEEIKNIANEKLVNSNFSKNNIEQIKKKFEYKTNKLIKIITKSGKEIICTPNHKIFVYENLSKNWKKSLKYGLKKGKIIEKKADELSNYDLLISPNKIDYPQNEIIMPEIKYNSKYLATPEQRKKILELSKNHSGYEIAKILGCGSYRVYNILKNKINVKKHPIFPYYINRDFAELLGMICGDGNLNMQKNSWYAQITDKNKENLEYYRKILEKFNINSKITNCGNRQRLSIYSKEFVNYLKTNFKEIVCKSPQRHISKIITKCKDEIIKGFIRGLFDSEGHIQEHSFIITNTSKKLLQETQMLLERIGIQSYIQKLLTPQRKIGENIIKETIFYQLCISSFNNMNYFNKEIGVTRSDKKERIEKYFKNKKINLCKTRIKFNEYLNLEPIKTIEKFEVENVSVYDLEIENNHNYFANGILVHNSIQQEELSEFLSEIVSIAKSFNNINMKLIICDSEIKDVYEVRNGNIDTILNLKIAGGGGTSHVPVYEYVKENLPNTKFIINFSDGYTSFPNEESIKTIWVITKNGCEEEHIPFGEVIKLNE